MIVHKQINANYLRWAQMRTMWQAKTHWEGDMRGHFQQHFTFSQRFADQAEFIVLKVAQAIVNEF